MPASKCQRKIALLSIFVLATQVFKEKMTDGGREWEFHFSFSALHKRVLWVVGDAYRVIEYLLAPPGLANVRFGSEADLSAPFSSRPRCAHHPLYPSLFLCQGDLACAVDENLHDRAECTVFQRDDAG